MAEQGNHVTYTGKSWRKKSYWEDLGLEVPESPKFLHRPARQYSSIWSHNNPCYLPLYFHYYGMDKVKAGKGYKKDGTPIGILGPKCPECDGTIISLQMNTSSRGMECTSEKVCDTCGLVQDGAFIVLGKQEAEYKTRPFDTHDEWIRRMVELEERQGNPDDIAVECELFASWTGNRPGDDTEVSTGGTHGFYEAGIGNQDEKLARSLGLKTKNAANYGNGSKEVMEYKLKLQMDYVDICKTQLCMNSLQVMDVKYLIKTYGTKHFHRRASNEDIIMSLCIHRMSKDMDGRRLSILLRTIDTGITPAVQRHVAAVADGT